MSGPRVIPEKRPVATYFTESATARTATGNSAAIVVPDHVSELFVGVNVTAFSGTSPTVVVQVQQQDANGIWQTLAATASLNSVTTAALNLTAGSFVLTGGSVRVRWVVTGTTPSLTFQTSIQGR